MYLLVDVVMENMVSIPESRYIELIRIEQKYKASDFNNDLSINNVLEALGSFSYKMFLELENAMLDIYEKLYSKRGEVRVITEKTVSGLKSELENSIRALENAQIEYCKISEIDINKRGVAYIPFFREEYRNIDFQYAFRYCIIKTTQCERKRYERD